MLYMTPSKDEIYKVVMNLKIAYALRPYGFGAIFFQNYRNIIKVDVINVVT